MACALGGCGTIKSQTASAPGTAITGEQASGEGAALAGAMSIKPGVWLYQLTDDGLALELTAKGTKYYKDDNLN